jgi:chemotaxis-related protein WspD
MTPELSSLVAQGDCWNRIGISGDRSCPELEVHIHCRNCPVFATAARGFFGRPAPEGYLAECATLLAEPVEAAACEDVSLFLFRLRGEWLALRTTVVVEVTSTRPVHTIPHRSNETFIGLVNLRGRLQLQFSMHGLLGVGMDADADAADAPADSASASRLVVVSREGRTWVFEAEEVAGVERIAKAQLGAVPSTLANPENSFSQAVIDWNGKSVGFLDDQRVFDALKGLSP